MIVCPKCGANISTGRPCKYGTKGMVEMAKAIGVSRPLLVKYFKNPLLVKSRVKRDAIAIYLYQNKV